MVATDDHLSQSAHAHAQAIIRIIAIVTIIPTFLVALTLILFREMQQKVFFKCLLMITIADMGLLIISLFGFLEDGSILCWVQGVLAVYFPLTSWFWTTLLYYCVFSVIYFEKIRVNMLWCHLFCWCFPLVLSFLPIITNNYGTGPINLQWCLIVARPSSTINLTEFWGFASFFFWFFFCILLMLVWTLLIFRRTIWQSSTHKAIVMKIYDKLWMYPFSMFICWFLNFLVLLSPDLGQTPTGVLLSMIFGMINGLISAIIFFWKSQEARSRWYSLLCLPRAGPKMSLTDVGPRGQFNGPVHAPTTTVRPSGITDMSFALNPDATMNSLFNRNTMGSQLAVLGVGLGQIPGDRDIVYDFEYLELLATSTPRDSDRSRSTLTERLSTMDSNGWDIGNERRTEMVISNPIGIDNKSSRLFDDEGNRDEELAASQLTNDLNTSITSNPYLNEHFVA